MRKTYANIFTLTQKKLRSFIIKKKSDIMLVIVLMKDYFDFHYILFIVCPTIYVTRVLHTQVQNVMTVLYIVFTFCSVYSLFYVNVLHLAIIKDIRCLRA